MRCRFGLSVSTNFATDFRSCTSVLLEGSEWGLMISNAFFFVFRTQKGVIVPGVPCGDRGNRDLESLRDRSHKSFAKKA